MSNPATLKPPDPDFGRKMQELRATRGSWTGGQKPLQQRYKHILNSVEDKIAGSLLDVFDEYIKELSVADPEQCSVHKKTLCCPDCRKPSQRKTYNHAAAQYLLDRLAGRPTSRSESTITVKLAHAMLESFAEAFAAVNELPDPNERKSVFADHFEILVAEYTQVS